MSVYTVQTLGFNGSALGLTAVSASDTFVNDGHTVLQVNNASASPITVTITSAQQCSQGFSHNVTVTVPASNTQLIGPFPTNRFNDTNNNVTVGYSATASVTASAYRINY